MFQREARAICFRRGWWNGAWVVAPIGSAPLWLLLANGNGGDSQRAVEGQVMCYVASIAALLFRWWSSGNYAKELGWGFLLVGHAAWFALPAAYQVLAPNVWFGAWVATPIEDQALLTGGQLIALFLLGNGVGYHAVRRIPQGIQKAPRGDVVVRQEHRLLLCVVALAFGVVPYAAFGGGLQATIEGVLAGRADKAWAASPESGYESSTAQTLFWLTRAFLVAAATLSGCYLTGRASMNVATRIGLSVVFCAATALVYFDQGTRSMLLMAVVPPCVVGMLAHSVVPHGFQRKRILATGAIVGAVLVSVTQLQLYYRSERSRQTMDVQRARDILAMKQQSDFFTETAIAVEAARVVPEARDLSEKPLWLFVVNVIPRVLWTEKPRPETIRVYTLHRWGVDIWEKGGNALPSVVGQYYMNWSWCGVAWAGCLFGMLGGGFGKVAQRGCLQSEWFAIGVSGLTFVFVSFRALTPGFHYATVAIAVCVVSYMLLTNLTRHARPI